MPAELAGSLSYVGMRGGVHTYTLTARVCMSTTSWMECQESTSMVPTRLCAVCLLRLVLLQPSPGVQSTPAATVGYKGIATTYLPRNHTVVKTVDIRGTTEAKYT